MYIRIKNFLLSFVARHGGVDARLWTRFWIRAISFALHRACASALLHYIDSNGRMQRARRMPRLADDMPRYVECAGLYA